MGEVILQFGDSVIGIDEMGNFNETIGGAGVGDSYYMCWREDEISVGGGSEEEWDL